MKDYYAILQVHPEADGEVITAAYHRLMRKTHPDTSQHPEAGPRAAELNEAYDVLKSAGSRAAYDRQRAAARQWAGEGLGSQQTIEVPRPPQPPAPPPPSLWERNIPRVALGVAVLAAAASIAAALAFWATPVEPEDLQTTQWPVLVEPAPAPAPEPEGETAPEPEPEVASPPSTPRAARPAKPKKKLRLYQPRAAEEPAEEEEEPSVE